MLGGGDRAAHDAAAGEGPRARAADETAAERHRELGPVELIDPADKARVPAAARLGAGEGQALMRTERTDVLAKDMYAINRRTCGNGWWALVATSVSVMP